MIAAQPKILAFLQNQWFKEPARVAKMYARCSDGQHPLDRRASLNKGFLFYKSLTGRRLRAALGPELCNRIIWEEISPQVGAKSSAAFPPDQNHIRAVIEHHKPDVILVFGSIAASATLFMRLLDAMAHQYTIIVGPHPAARGANLPDQLRNVRIRLEACLAARACTATSGESNAT